MKHLKFFTCILGLFVITNNCGSYKTQEQLEQSIARSPVLKSVNKLCTEMPRSDNFRFVKKQIGGNSELASLVFYYWSGTEPKEIEKFYGNWAKMNGWKILEENKYTKDRQTIIIGFEKFSGSNIEISCEEFY